MGRARIGVLGGTFDPIHVGHLALARAALAALALTELRLVPTGRSWQKQHAGANAAQRLEMVRLAATAIPQAIVDDREVRRAGPSYTIDTLAELRGELGADCALVLVLGSDQFLNLPTWHRWCELLGYAHIAVTQRERVGLDRLPPELDALTRECGRDALPDAPAGAIVFFSMPPVPVSASALRARIARGERPVELVPPEVLDYIDRHRLYR